MTAAATLADPNLSRIYGPDGAVRDLDWRRASSEVQNSFGRWSFTPPLPKGWEKETPKYRATRTVHPAANSRHATEAPFAHIGDEAEWQHGDRKVNAGEEISTKEWPHRSFVGLNDSAKHVLDLLGEPSGFVLPTKPWRDGQVIPRR